MADNPDQPYAGEKPAPARAASHVAAEGGTSLVENAFVQRPRREGGQEEDIFDPANFAKIKSRWLLDQFMPGGVVPYFVTSFLICTAAWAAGLALRIIEIGGDWVLAADGYLRSREWQLQPLLLFVHLVCLRLFKSIYSRHFELAFKHMDVPRAELDKASRWFFGFRVNLAALAIAAPFIAYRAIVYFPSDRLLVDYGLASRGPEAYLLLGLWSVEWLMFGYYAWLIVTGAILMQRILRRYDFRDSVDLVLADRHYRPLFAVTTRSTTLVVFFGLIQTAYIAYTAATWGEYAGLIALAVAVVFSFSMTWGAVRGELGGLVRGAVQSLEQSYRASREKLGGMADVAGIEDDIKRVQVQLKMQLALQQLDYLVTKYESVGRRELMGLVFRALSPVGSVLARVIRWGSLLAAVGLSGFAALQGEPPKNTRAQRWENRAQERPAPPENNRR
ncbi:MAG: hypothetical protein IT462_04325 [Planctomycetes bacterium]|nr:hypothetical protein [Planctomycetota bacterium]